MQSIIRRVLLFNVSEVVGALLNSETAITEGLRFLRYVRTCCNVLLLISVTVRSRAVVNLHNKCCNFQVQDNIHRLTMEAPPSSEKPAKPETDTSSHSEETTLDSAEIGVSKANTETTADTEKEATPLNEENEEKREEDSGENESALVVVQQEGQNKEEISDKEIAALVAAAVALQEKEGSNEKEEVQEEAASNEDAVKLTLEAREDDVRERLVQMEKMVQERCEEHGQLMKTKDGKGELNLT